ncbi:MAG: RNA pyrophosphohydrolase, partial [Ramlibacter sp.]
FKRDVYQRALQELSRFLTPQHERRHSSRYLRQPRAPGSNPPAAKAVVVTETTVVTQELELLNKK